MSIFFEIELKDGLYDHQWSIIHVPCMWSTMQVIHHAWSSKIPQDSLRFFLADLPASLRLQVATPWQRRTAPPAAAIVGVRGRRRCRQSGAWRRRGTPRSAPPLQRRSSAFMASRASRLVRSALRGTAQRLRESASCKKAIRSSAPSNSLLRNPGTIARRRCGKLLLLL